MSFIHEKINRLTNWFFSGGGGLSPLEIAVLNAVRACLSDEYLQQQWDKQIQAINKVQRLFEGREVDFFRMKGSHPTFDADLMFPNQAGELHVASVYLMDESSGKRVNISVWTVKGFVFSFEYDLSPKDFEHIVSKKLPHNLRIECKMRADLSSGVA